MYKNILEGCVYMKKTSLGKLILNIIVVIAFIISLCTLVPSLFDKEQKENTFKLVTTLISLFSGFILYIYNNSNTIFFWVNKLRTYFSFKTVRWEMTYRTPGLSIENAEKLKEELCRILESKSIQVLKDDEKEESKIIKFKNDKGIEAEFELRWNKGIDDKLSMTIIFRSQTSHSDVRKQWSFYRNIIEETLKVISEESNYNKKPYEEKSYYTVSLNMEKNPFYLLTIKTYDKPKDIKFDLSFKVDGVNFKTTNKKIVLTTNDITKVDTVLKDYVMLGKVS